MRCKLTSMVILKEKDRQKVLAHIHALLKSMSVTKSGKTSVPISFLWDTRLEIVGSKLEVQGLKNRKNLVRSFILDSLVNLRKKNVTKPGWAEFSKALAREADKYQRRPSENFHILFPFHLNGPWISKKRIVTVLGAKFQRVSWVNVRKFRGWRDFLDRCEWQLKTSLVEKTHFEDGWFIPLILGVQGRTFQEAFEYAEKQFDLLRAVINLVTIGRQVTTKFGVPSPFGFSLPPRVYGVFNADYSYKTHYYQTEQYVYQVRRLTSESGKEVERILSQLNSCDEDMQSLLVESLLKYVHSMDTSDWRVAFLTLWQILEVIAAPTQERLKYKEITKRIRSLIGDLEDDLLRDLLDELARSRHSLVHEGKFSQEGSREVSYLKVIAENAMSCLLSQAKKFPDRRSLTEFYKNSHIDVEGLRIRMRVVETLLQQLEQAKEIAPSRTEKKAVKKQAVKKKKVTRRKAQRKKVTKRKV